jgi:hypothetical protein
MNLLKKISIKFFRHDIETRLSLQNKHLKIYLDSSKQNRLLRLQKFYFTGKNNYSLNEIKQKLEKEGSVKVYESKYPFTSEKFLAQISTVFLIISSTTIFMHHSFLMKAINLIFVFTPSLAIIIEVLANKTRFVKNIVLIPGNKILITTLWGKKETLAIQNLNKVEEDKRFEKIMHTLNNSSFIIFSNKQFDALYHLPREGIFLNDDLVHKILEGKSKL